MHSEASDSSRGYAMQDKEVRKSIIRALNEHEPQEAKAGASFVQQAQTKVRLCGCPVTFKSMQVLAKCIFNCCRHL